MFDLILGCWQGRKLHSMFHRQLVAAVLAVAAMSYEGKQEIVHAVAEKLVCLRDVEQIVYFFCLRPGFPAQSLHIISQGQKWSKTAPHRKKW